MLTVLMCVTGEETEGEGEEEGSQEERGGGGRGGE